MCPREKVVDECRECLDGIQQDAAVIMKELKEDIKNNFKETQSAMKTEWAIFLEDCRISNNSEKKELEQKVEKDSKSSLGIIKFVMSLCLALCLACVGAISYNSGKLSTLESDKADKTELPKYLSIRSAKELNDIREAYYKQLFMLNKEIQIDSTNYNWIISHYLNEPSRGEHESYRSDFTKQQNENLLNKKK